MTATFAVMGSEFSLKLGSVRKAGTSLVNPRVLRNVPFGNSGLISLGLETCSGGPATLGQRLAKKVPRALSRIGRQVQEKGR